MRVEQSGCYCDVNDDAVVSEGEEHENEGGHEKDGAAAGAESVSDATSQHQRLQDSCGAGDDDDPCVGCEHGVDESVLLQLPQPEPLDAGLREFEDSEDHEERPLKKDCGQKQQTSQQQQPPPETSSCGLSAASFA